MQIAKHGNQNIINSWITRGIDIDVCQPWSQMEMNMCSHRSPSGLHKQESLHYPVRCWHLLPSSAAILFHTESHSESQFT